MSNSSFYFNCFNILKLQILVAIRLNDILPIKKRQLESKKRQLESKKRQLEFLITVS